MPAITPDVVRTERRDATLVITIDRPEARNAVNQQVAEGIHEALDELSQDDTLCSGVLTGAGEVFCAGMDLKAFVRGERSQTSRGFAGIVEDPPAKPLIASVEGYALAGGFEIVLACDLIVASTEAVFGLPEPRRGLVAAGGGLLRLSHRIAYHQAMEIALLGQHVPARRALELGLINRLVAPGEALAAALQIAEELAQNAPLAVVASKRIMVESSSWPREEAFSLQSSIADPVASSADAIEGATAFADRRAPNWQGR